MRLASSLANSPSGPRWVLVFLFLCAPLLFASNMVAARWLSGSVPPVTLGFGRWLVAALVLLPVVWAPLRQGALRQAPPGVLALLALLGGVVSVAPQYGAAAYTSAGNIALIAAMSPLLVALIERVVWGCGCGSPWWRASPAPSPASPSPPSGAILPRCCGSSSTRATR
ncbi:EamA family transporter [Teichococcus aestuarii]|uniref:EamA family transporter n=1 Tax=Teichococcus aestuarii TaxID=568898 RepID=UPI00361ED9F5